MAKELSYLEQIAAKRSEITKLAEKAKGELAEQAASQLTNLGTLIESYQELGLGDALEGDIYAKLRELMPQAGDKPKGTRKRVQLSTEELDKLTTDIKAFMPKAAGDAKKMSEFKTKFAGRAKDPKIAEIVKTLGKMIGDKSSATYHAK